MDYRPPPVRRSVPNAIKEIVLAILSSEPFRSVLVWLAASSFGRRILNTLSRSHGVFASFEEGWSAARRVTPVGHEALDEIAAHLALLKSLRPSDYAVLFWLSTVSACGLKIYDWGGNAGNLYYGYLNYMNQAPGGIEWTVFDLPPIVAEGQRIAAACGASGLKFTTSLDPASDCNVLLVSGALHYWEKSVPAFLEQFLRLPESIIVNRTPIHDVQPPFITVQRTGWCAFPCIVRNADELVSDFARHGYDLVDRWSAFELSIRLPLFPDRTVSHYSGFYFHKRNP
jgi:putative methyltransferase (TIGR04325 family)